MRKRKRTDVNKMTTENIYMHIYIYISVLSNICQVNFRALAYNDAA